MTTNHSYITSIEFIKNLTFNFVETYSFQRGQAYELEQIKLENEFEELKFRKSRSNDLTDMEEEQLIKLEKLCGFTQYLLNENHQFHYSSEKQTVLLRMTPG